jgi:hypothetical protein
MGKIYKEQKKSRCLYCQENGIKFKYRTSEMKSVDDPHLGVGLICRACYEACMTEPAFVADACPRCGRNTDANCICRFNEYFEETILNEKGEICSYFNFSGGERKRIDLAMLFTFIDIRRLQSNVSVNICLENTCKSIGFCTYSNAFN